MTDDIRELDEFRREVHFALANDSGDDLGLAVVDVDGNSPVVVALGDERLAVLLRRVQAVGGFANAFVRRTDGVAVVAFLDANGAIDPASADDMTGDDRPSADATVDIFIDYLLNKPGGVLLPKSLATEESAQIVRARQEPVSV
ncbi:hypothetical protein [Herbiconiux daphne]|uniref:Uncharacterized protein n=1 Tax=Herbiconiux daphne TaxID=2970914 RepID=A0ABT2GWQ4_9MICO|nr:hypothetical protein [Herbiconiux daphne]MCS5732394.1 hypothetical protein [Herbiconiux daphne]